MITDYTAGYPVPLIFKCSHISKNYGEKVEGAMEYRRRYDAFGLFSYEAEDQPSEEYPESPLPVQAVPA